MLWSSTNTETEITANTYRISQARHAAHSGMSHFISLHLSDEDIEYMRHQIVKKQPPFGGPDLSPDVEGDIDDDLIEAYFFIIKGIIELSAKTYVKEFEIQDMGLGDLDDSGYELHDDFARLEKEGKLVIDIERIKLTDKLM